MKDDRIYESIWQYLDESGVLENGTEEEIQQAKKEYWKIYQRQYKRKMRKTKRQVVLWFSQREIDQLKKVMKGYRNSFPQFVKQGAMAYANQRYLVPDIHMVGRIEQHLSLIRQSVHELSERDSNNWFSDTKRYRRIEKMLNSLQSELVDRLRNPMLLKTYLRGLKENDPDQLKEIKQILDHDH